MAKRNTKQGMYQQRSAQPKRRAPAGKNASKQARASGTSSSGRSASGARSFNRSVQPSSPIAARPNLLMVRIAAIVIVVAAIAGGTVWALNLKGSYGAAEIAGLIALAFLAGLGLAVAVRTEQIVARITKKLQERR